MAQPTKEYLAKYRIKNASKLKAQQTELYKKKRDARNADPVALAEWKRKRREEYKKKHPNARTQEEINASRIPKKVDPKPGHRECVDCKETKPLDQFPRHGTHGHKEFCLACRDIRTRKSYLASKSRYNRRKSERLAANPPVELVAAPTPQLDQPKPTMKRQTLADDGWRLVLSLGDPHEIIKVYMRGALIRYVRSAAVGQYSPGKTSYGIAFDTTGVRYQSLATAERMAERA